MMSSKLYIRLLVVFTTVLALSSGALVAYLRMPTPEPDEVAPSLFEKIDRLAKYQTVFCTDSTDSQRALTPAEVVQLCSILKRLKVSPGTKGLFYPNVRWQFDANGPSDYIVIMVCYAPNRIIVDNEVYVLSSLDYAQLCKLARAADEDPLIPDDAAEKGDARRGQDDSSVTNGD